MAAALRLSCYKCRHSLKDFAKVLVGILIFEVLILYIEKKGFMSVFETTRMALFLLIFSSSLLVLVQNSIYISKERAILERDFFSILNRTDYALASLLFNAGYAIVESLVFTLGYQGLSQWFAKDLPSKGLVFHSFTFEVILVSFLLFLASHYMALLISALVGESEISSVILAVIVGIAQFSLSGTILQLPKSIEKVQDFIFLGYGHKVFGATNNLRDIPGMMAKYHVPIEQTALKHFQLSRGDMVGDFFILFAHALVYGLLFCLVLRFKKEK